MSKKTDTGTYITTNASRTEKPRKAFHLCAVTNCNQPAVFPDPYCEDCAEVVARLDKHLDEYEAGNG